MYWTDVKVYTHSVMMAVGYPWLNGLENSQSRHEDHNNTTCTDYRLLVHRWSHFVHIKKLCSLWRRHNGRDGVSNHQHHDCLFNRLIRRKSKKISKLRVTGLCAGNSPVTGEFPAQMACNAENVSIWWRHHVTTHIVPIRTKPEAIRRKHIVQSTGHLAPFSKIFDEADTL